jgi:hypothetical protein
MEDIRRAIRLCKEVLTITNSKLTDKEKEQVLSKTYYSSLDQLFKSPDEVEEAWEDSPDDETLFVSIFTTYVKQLLERLLSVEGD